MAETQKAKLMRVLGVSAEEAEAIIADDKDIDRNKPKPYDLSKDKLKIAQTFTKTGTRTQTQTTPRKTVKENPTKASLIQLLAKVLSDNGYNNVDIANTERLITFESGGNKFDLTLIQKRKPKGE